MPFKSHILFSAVLLAGMNAWAAGNFVSLSGDVRLESNDIATSAANRQRVEAGTTVHTGSNGSAVLRLDDGQQVAMSPNTSFKIDQFRFDSAKPEQNNVSMSMFKGALRILTGLIGQRDNSKFVLKTPTATIGIRGTDFMVAMVNPVYMQVIQGGIAATNTAGTVAFAAGSTATVAGAGTLAASISAAALPAAVTASFSSLGSLALAGAGAAGAGAASGAGGGAGAGAGAAGATGAAAGGVGALGITAGVVGAVAVISASTPSSSSTGTTGSQ